MEQLLKLRYLLVLLLSNCSTLDQIEDTYEHRFQRHNVVNIQDLQSSALLAVDIRLMHYLYEH